MLAASTPETSVNFYQTTPRNIPEDSHLLIVVLFVIAGTGSFFCDSKDVWSLKVADHSPSVFKM
jgi:hypothetical protein